MSLVVWPEDSMSQLLGCLEHLKTCSMVTSVWGTENNHRGINRGSRADDGAYTLVFGLKILVQQLPGEPVRNVMYIVFKFSNSCYLQDLFQPQRSFTSFIIIIIIIIYCTIKSYTDIFVNICCKFHSCDHPKTCILNR